MVRRAEHSARNLSDSAAHHNRFAVLDPPVLADDPTCSDTESAMEVDDLPEVAFDLNSQDRPQPPILHRDVRTASCLGRGFAKRVGFVPSGLPLPRAIRQQCVGSSRP